MSERAQRITEEREICQVHGFDRVVYDVTLGVWRCVGEGDHWPRANTNYPPEIASDVARLLRGAQ